MILRIIRLIVNWVIILTLPIWTPYYVIFKLIDNFSENGIEENTLLKGKQWLWE